MCVDVTYVYDDVTYAYDEFLYMSTWKGQFIGLIWYCVCVYDDVTYVYDDVTYAYDVEGAVHWLDLVLLRVCVCV